MKHSGQANRFSYNLSHSSFCGCAKHATLRKRERGIRSRLRLRKQIPATPTTKNIQMNNARKASCIYVWSVKKTAVQLVKSVLIASVFALAIECFYLVVLKAWGTVILDFILSWIILSAFTMLFSYASERDKKSPTKD